MKKKEIDKLMDESEDRLIEFIMTKLNPNEKEEFIKELIKGGASNKRVQKFKRMKSKKEFKNDGEK